MRLSSTLLCLFLLGALLSCDSDNNEYTPINTLDDAKLAVASLETIKSVVLKELRQHSYNNTYTVDLQTSGLTGEATMVGIDNTSGVGGHCVQSGNKHATLDLNLTDYSLVESLSLGGSGTILYDQSSYNIVLCGQYPDVHYWTSTDTLEIRSEQMKVTIKQKNIHDVVEVRVKYIKSSDTRKNPEISESTISYLKSSSGVVFEW